MTFFLATIFVFAFFAWISLTLWNVDVLLSALFNLHWLPRGRRCQVLDITGAIWIVSAALGCALWLVHGRELDAGLYYPRLAMINTLAVHGCAMLRIIVVTLGVPQQLEANDLAVGPWEEP
ncbi:hypothetical protein LEL_04220 [Akanthomyces lecanii RCEF 1005]|uniref:Uncharacterized protein n=1 Tax=Akanthomyces lecanii RCEF 1005 TaxID=1081108 RepID=A0A168H781_CORDF|nr:hypothetical protein LEL_04220 [Akanthomyces lecanii RCEF 1005]